MTFGRGILDGAPFVIVILPFGALFGLLATEAGLPIAQVMALSALVIAGASQLTAVELIEQGAPALLVLGAALTVNLRMAMYSAALAPHLGAAPLWQRAAAAYLLVDQVYALSTAAYEARPDAPMPRRMAYYAGTAAPVVPCWFGATYAGAAFGAAFPAGLPLEAVVPLAFMALVAPALRTLAHLGAALTSAVLAVLLAGLPCAAGLPVAALAAMVVGAEIERRT